MKSGEGLGQFKFWWLAYFFKLMVASDLSSISCDWLMTVTLKGTKNLKKAEASNIIHQSIFFCVWEKPECVNLTGQRKSLSFTVHWLLYDSLKILFLSIYVYVCLHMFNYMSSYMYGEA